MDSDMCCDEPKKPITETTLLELVTLSNDKRSISDIKAHIKKINYSIKLTKSSMESTNG